MPKRGDHRGGEGERVWLTVADPNEPEAELRRLKAFLARHPSDNLKPRPDEIFAKTIENTLAFRVQTSPKIDDAGLGICAQGSVFERRNGRVLEIGAINVSPEYQGLRIQKLMMRIAIIKLLEHDIRLFDAPDAMIFAAVGDHNEPSWRSIEGVGFIRAGSRDPVWAEPEIWGKGGMTPTAFEQLGKRMYVLPRHKIPDIQDAMSEFAADPYLRSGERMLRVIFGEGIERFANPNFYSSFRN